MDGKRISELPSATALDGTEVFPANQAAATTKATIAQVTRYTRDVLGEVRSVGADYTITGRDDTPTIEVTTGSSDVTITLPALSAMTPGDTFEIAKVDSGTGKVTISRAGSDTIEGLTSKELVGQDSMITLRASSSGWQVVYSRGARPVGNAVRVGSHEYQFTDDNELDYSSSITDGGSGTITFTELPENTTYIEAFIRADDAAGSPQIRFGRASGSSNKQNVEGIFADAGSLNRIAGMYTIATEGNTVYYDNASVSLDANFVIFGYRVAE